MEAEALNWTAVLVGTVAAFLMGWLLYLPKVFGARWAEGSRLSPEPPETLPFFAMATQIAALFVLALVIGVTAQTSALITAVLAILAAALLVAAQDAFTQKSAFATAVDTGYVLLSGVLMIAAQGIF